MQNISLYRKSLLLKFLNPKYQPEEFKKWLLDETAIVLSTAKNPETVLDVGCGVGRHLFLLNDKIIAGLDVSKLYLGIARKILGKNAMLIEADARKIPLKKDAKFDIVIATNNTLGNIEGFERVIEDMKTLGRVVVAGVYSKQSTDIRLGLYKNVGLTPIEATDKHILTKEGFSSRHFTKDEIAKKFVKSEIIDLDDFGYVVVSPPKAASRISTDLGHIQKKQIKAFFKKLSPFLESNCCS